MREINNTAQYYGHGATIRRYAGFSRTLPLPVGIQHGWYHLSATAVDYTDDCPEVWLWSERIQEVFRSAYPDLNTRVVGAPLLYKLRNIGYQAAPFQERAGSIVFPAHSSELIDVDFDYERYATMLMDLPEEFHPITVCMYYTDMGKGRHEIFERYGFEVVSNGSSRLAQDFLDNLIRYAQGKRYALSNQCTSALLYGAALGLRGVLYGPDHSVDGEAKGAEPSSQSGRVSFYDSVRPFFEFDTDPAVQREYAEAELGLAAMLDSGEMRRVLTRHTLRPSYWREAVRGRGLHPKTVVRKAYASTLALVSR